MVLLGRVTPYHSQRECRRDGVKPVKHTCLSRYKLSPLRGNRQPSINSWNPL